MTQTDTNRSSTERALCHFLQLSTVAWLCLAPSSQAQDLVPVGADFQVNSQTRFDQYDSSVAATSNGEFVVVWQHTPGARRTVQGQRFDRLGQPKGEEFLVSSNRPSSYGPAIAAREELGFVVVWSDDYYDYPRGVDVYAQRFDAIGNKVGSESLVNDHRQDDQLSAAVASASDGDLVIVWESWGGSGDDGSGWSIQGRLFDESLRPKGPQFQVNSHSTGHQRSPSVSADDDGNFVVVWESSQAQDEEAEGIQARRFDRNAQPLGSDFRVDSFRHHQNRSPFVAVDPGGNAVVVWEGGLSPGNDNWSLSIQAQRFATRGELVGPQFQVNTYRHSDQERPEVAIDAAGDFIVVWTSASSAGTDNDHESVQAQAFDRLGNRRGSEFQVNEYTTGPQYLPSVSVSPGGSVVFTWSSIGSSGSDTFFSSVQGRLFAVEEWLKSAEYPGFRFRGRITSPSGEVTLARHEPDCLPETVCVSGAVPGRSETFIRIVGPKPNGYLWPTIVKFSTSTVEIWVEQESSGLVKYYLLEGASPGIDVLPGRFDRSGFLPDGELRDRSTLLRRESRPPPSGNWMTTSDLPDYRFQVRIESPRGDQQLVRPEPLCIDETLCLSGAIPGRSEVFLRVVGPKPNGYMWPTMVKFTTSQVEVWIEQISTGDQKYYLLEGASPGSDDLTGLFDRTGFLP